MANERANALDKVRAAAIYNTEKRFREAAEKAAEKGKVAELASELTSGRAEQLEEDAAKRTKAENLKLARAAKKAKEAK